MKLDAAKIDALTAACDSLSTRLDAHGKWRAGRKAKAKAQRTKVERGDAEDSPQDEGRRLVVRGVGIEKEAQRRLESYSQAHGLGWTSTQVQQGLAAWRVAARQARAKKSDAEGNPKYAHMTFGELKEARQRALGNKPAEAEALRKELDFRSMGGVKPTKRA